MDAPNIRPKDPTERRLRLRDAGFSPVPIQGKAPPLKGWQDKLDSDPEEIALWGKLYRYAQSTGILTARTPAFDIDIHDQEAAGAVEALVRRRLDHVGPFPVRFGKAPKRAILFQTDQPFPKIQIVFDAPDGSQQRLEFLGNGNQVVAFGLHPDTQKPYTWYGGEPGDVTRAQLPSITEDEAKELVEAAAKLLIDEYGYAVHVTGATKKPRAPATNGGDQTTTTILDTSQQHPREWLEDIANIIDHDCMVSLAQKLINSGMSGAAAANFIGAQLENSSFPRDERYQRRFKEIKSAVRTAEGKKEKKERAQLPAAERQKFTEDALALVFAERHEPDLRYVAAWSRWQIFDGLLWLPEETRKCFDRARALCRERAAECKTHRTAIMLRAARTVAAVERMAQSDRRLVGLIDQWDLDDQVVNIGDGQNGD
jgi:Bifunctional DNA primase/polymerase, N-terminal/D5 N terminal like